MKHLARSYERLVKISQHPTLRKYVKRVFFEDFALRQLEFSGWKKVLKTPFTLPNSPICPKLPPGHASIEQIKSVYEEQQAWRAMYTRHEHTHKYKLQCWRPYQDKLAETKMLRLAGTDTKSLEESICRFPNLKMVKIVTDASSMSDIVAEAFTPTLTWPNNGWNNNPEHDDFEEWGVVETQHIEKFLLSLDAGNINIETFEADWFHWKILDDLDSVSQAMVLPVFTNLKHLDLIFMNLYGQNSRQNFANHRESMLGTLLRQANGLELLRLEFDSPSDTFAGRFKDFRPPLWEHLALSKTWPNLKHLDLGSIDVITYPISCKATLLL